MAQSEAGRVFAWAISRAPPSAASDPSPALVSSSSIVSSALPYVKAGKLHALGVASQKRLAVMPDVPTIAEQGFPRFEAVSWYALMAPAGTPREVIARINHQALEVLANPALKEKLATLGMDPSGGTPQELATTIEQDSARWAGVIRKRQITVD